MAIVNLLARYMAVRLVAGLPKGVAGVDFDAFVGNAAVNDCNLEAITVPTLIIHTKDDHVASHEASERAAERLPVRDELARFFGERGEPSDRR